MTTVNDNHHNAERPLESHEEAIEALEQHIDGDRWDNFGDANPGLHGGIWVQYDTEYQWFTVVVTFQSAELGDGRADRDDLGDQWVYQGDIGWSDGLVADDGTLGRDLRRELDAVHGASPSIKWLLADEVDVRGHVGHLGREVLRSRRVQKDSYEAVLDACGVDPAEE